MFGRVNKSLHQTWLFTEYPHVSCHINTYCFIVPSFDLFHVISQCAQSHLVENNLLLLSPGGRELYVELSDRMGRPRHLNWHVLGCWWVLLNMGHNKIKAQQQLTDLHMKLCQMQLSICGNTWPRSISHHQPRPRSFSSRVLSRLENRGRQKWVGKKEGKPPPSTISRA